MIKFFRHIRKDLMEKNKTGKYLKYAIGEIILVVIGILIALQINNWNIEKTNRALEVSILADIHQEFLQNKTQLDTVLFYHNRAYKGIKKLVDLFPIDTKKDNLDSISAFLYDSFWFFTFNPSQGTTNAIINTSSFDIIQNRTLRYHLLSWNDLAKDFNEEEVASKNYYATLIEPYFSKNFDYDFDFNNKRNNIKALESLEFEYLMKLRLGNLNDLMDEKGEKQKVIESLTKIIELTKPKDI
tara:strand:- start:47140 stop:47865 length:726 start_codon:yes stop_codon:yes gene_type:complete